jgi:hypothetical protein
LITLPTLKTSLVAAKLYRAEILDLVKSMGLTPSINSPA